VRRRIDRPAPLDTALPRSFSARYGDGVTRGLSLGGGGLFFIAWQVAYLHRLAADGLRVDTADRVVGTSAGSVVATALVAGHLNRVHRELSVLAKVPAVVSALAPSSNLHPSQLRAVELFWQAADADVSTVRAIGHAALAATAPPPAVLRRNISLLVGGGRWPSTALHVSCVDAYSGERCIVTHRAGVTAAGAAAASSAVPGLFSPHPIGDRRCMDGGVSGTGVHLDVLGGARRVLVLALTDGRELVEGMMTAAPGSIQRELDDLAATGTNVELRIPEAVDPNALMSPAAVPEAMAMGARQAAADRESLGAFWA
jgi:NTE family protein